MKKHSFATNIRALLMLNAALLIVLAAITFSPAADAQARARGEYVMVGGRAQGATSNVVYIVDTINQEMVVITFNPSVNQLEGVSYRNLAVDAREAARGPGPQRGR